MNDVLELLETQNGGEEWPRGPTEAHVFTQALKPVSSRTAFWPREQDLASVRYRRCARFAPETS